MYQALLALHIGSGALALATYWIAGFARKGKRTHQWSGRVYLLAMAVVLLSAPPLAITQIAQGNPLFGLFLLYLLILTTSTCWCAWRAVREKRTPQRYYAPWYRRLALANLTSGLGVLIVGIVFARPLLAVFSTIGIVRGLHMLHSGRRPPAQKWWLVEHYGNQIGNGIATHIAFLSIGLPRLLPESWQGLTAQLAWYGPLVVASLAALWIARKYGPWPTRAARAVGEPAPPPQNA